MPQEPMRSRFASQPFRDSRGEHSGEATKRTRDQANQCEQQKIVERLADKGRHERAGQATPDRRGGNEVDASVTRATRYKRVPDDGENEGENRIYHSIPRLEPCCGLTPRVKLRCPDWAKRTARCVTCHVRQAPNHNAGRAVSFNGRYTSATRLPAPRVPPPVHHGEHR